MPHIHTEPGQHDHTASAFIIHLDDVKSSEPEILFHVHKKIGKLMQFGGHIELNENTWQAISHEIPEESGYNMNQLSILQPSLRLHELSNAILHPTPVAQNTHHYGGGEEEHYHVDTSYAFVTHELPETLPGDDESTDFAWISLNDFHTMDPKLFTSKSRQIAMFILEKLLDAWEEVPTSTFK